MSLFRERFPHYTRTAAWSAHSDFTGSRVYATLGVTCLLHCWQNDRGILRATAVTQGWNGHRRSESLPQVKVGKLIPFSIYISANSDLVCALQRKCSLDSRHSEL